MAEAELVACFLVQLNLLMGHRTQYLLAQAVLLEQQTVETLPRLVLLQLAADKVQMAKTQIVVRLARILATDLQVDQVVAVVTTTIQVH